MKNLFSTVADIQEQIGRTCRVGAVDPGLKSGAVVLLGSGEVKCWRGFKVHDDIVRAVRDAVEGWPDAIVLEKVGARPGQGVCSMFSFGKSTGVALGAMLVTSPDSPVVPKLFEPVPQVWQNWVKREFGLGKMAAGTFDSRKVVEKYFPQQYHKALSHRRGLDHNACDAALMALWGMNQISKN